MSIQDEINLHSLQITGLLGTQEIHNDEIMSLSKAVSLISHVQKDQGKNILDCAKQQAETRRIVDKMEYDAKTKRHIIEFIGHTISKPRIMALILGSILLFDIHSIFTIVFKHFTGW